MTRASRHAARPRQVLLLAIAVCCLLACTACGAASGAGSPPSTGTAYHRLVAAYLSYARCARKHGMPNLPDPQVDVNGNDHYPSLDARGPWQWPHGVLVGCARVWTEVHQLRDEYDNLRGFNRALTPTQALAMARCMRRHGFPTFPDPNAEGQFTQLPAGFSKTNPSPAARAALAVCRRH
jgi:hypothetical protein